MDDNKLNRIFAESDCITNKMMTDYLDGKLSGKEKNIVEVHLESCELCKDEFDGLKSMEDKNKLPDIVSLLNTQISKIYTRRKKIALFPQVSAMAAIVLLLVGFVWVFFYIIYMNPESLRKKELALLESKEKEEIQKIIDDSRINPNTEIDIPVNQSDKKLNQLKSKSKTEKEKIDVISGANRSEIASNNEISKDDQDKSNEAEIKSNPIVNMDLVEDRKKLVQQDTITNNLAFISSESEKQVKKSDSKTKLNKKEQVELTEFQVAIAEFDKRDYKKAIGLFLKIKEDQTNKDMLAYYLAQAYQNIDNEQKAIKYYDKVIAIPTSNFYEGALWYKSQLQIKAGQKHEAILNLNILVNRKGKYNQQASQQIDSLSHQ